MTVSKTRVIATAVIAVFGATAAGWAGQSASRSADSGLLVRAEFADASPLLVGNDVKANGVPVGEVASLAAEGNHAVVTLLLNPAALPMHEDARFTIRPVSLLGERFVELNQGTPTAPPLPTGATVPLTQTATNTDLDQVLDTFDDPTGAGLAALVTTLGDGVQGNGANTAATLRALSPALTDTDAFVGVLRDQNALLNRLVDRMEPVLSALAADQGGRLDRLMGSANTLLTATAAQQRQLEATLAELPGALASATTALDQVSATARQTTPDLRSLRPLTGQLRDISSELYDFTDALDPALSSAQPVLRRGKELFDEARPVAAELRRAGPDLSDTAASARPLVGELSDNLDNVYNFLRFWAQTANGHDGLSNYFRGFVVVNPQSATGLLPPALARAVPLPGATEQPPPGPAALLTPGGLLGAHQPGRSHDSTAADPDDHGPSAGGATGLDPQQEKGMAGFLLGGDH